MKVHPLPVVVAGSRFGQFYAAGLAASSAYRVAGILGQGSAHCRAGRASAHPCSMRLNHCPRTCGSRASRSAARRAVPTGPRSRAGCSNAGSMS